MLAACSVQYGGSYETAKFSHNTADGLTMVGVGMSVAMVRRGRSASAAGRSKMHSGNDGGQPRGWRQAASSGSGGGAPMAISIQSFQSIVDRSHSRGFLTQLLKTLPAAGNEWKASGRGQRCCLQVSPAIAKGCEHLQWPIHWAVRLTEGGRTEGTAQEHVGAVPDVVG